MTDRLERWHLGPWTARGTLPGQPLRPGLRRTPDELNFDIVGLARILGRRLSAREELLVRLWQNELRPTHTRLCGVHELAGPDDAKLLAATAAEAFDWLAARAPDGYRFVLRDAVYLEPDVDGEVVTVDGVIAEAVARGIELPAARLASSHVRPDGTVGHVACTWAGPFGAVSEAAAFVEAARAELVAQLRNGGADDLADSAPRWVPVPVYPVGDQVATK